MEGGNSMDGDYYAPPPNLMYGMEHGGSPRENAKNFQLKQDSEQNKLGQQLGGVRRKTRRSRCKCKMCLTHSPCLRRRFIKYGGEGQAPMAGEKIPVAQFAGTGPAVSPLSSTRISQQANQALLKAKVDAKGDGDMMGGRKTKNHKNSRRAHNHTRKTKNGGKSNGKKVPYSISAKRVAKSPFKNISALKKTLKAHKSGRRIGYTQKSSLRSMGLIKRSNGTYCLGDKYKR